MINHLKPLRILLSLLLSISVVHSQEGETITVQNKTHLLCVNENNESPIYFYPPIVSEGKTQSIILNNEGWNVITSSDSYLGPVRDKRWEDFPTYYTDSLSFTPKTSKTFSVLTNRTLSIEFYIKIENVEENSYFLVELEELNEWVDFTFLIKNGTVDILQNNMIIRSTPALNPTNITINSSANAYWKTHDYKWAMSSSEGTNNFVVEDKDKSCLMFYTLLCSTCSLEISDSTGLINIISNYDEINDSIQLWQSQKILITPNDKNEITIARKVTGNVANGYWGIDIRSCSSVINDKAIFEVKTSETEKNIERKCFNLNNEMGLLTRRKRELISEELLFNCNEPGILGRKCDLKCADILGEASPYCEQHRICRNSKCLCAWGFGGISCDEACQDGKWGMSCEKQCPSPCRKSCDKITGDCMNTDSTFPFLGVVMGAVAVVIVLIVALTSISMKVRRRENDLEDNEQELRGLNSGTSQS